jgi:hypothetical protein
MKVTVRGEQRGISAAALLASIRSAPADAAPEVPEAPPRVTLLLDEDSGVLRQRLVGGDRLARGSTVAIRFTAARADRLVHRAKLDLRIGMAHEAPVHGTLVHRIAYAVSFDGGATFAPEKPLEARALDTGAVVHEATQVIPADAASMLLYAHVKALLVADGQVTEIADVYDNPGGAFTNYAFDLR